MLHIWFWSYFANHMPIIREKHKYWYTKIFENFFFLYTLDKGKNEINWVWMYKCSFIWVYHVRQFFISITYCLCNILFLHVKKRKIGKKDFKRSISTGIGNEDTNNLHFYDDRTFFSSIYAKIFFLFLIIVSF